MKLYYNKRSPYARKAIITAYEKGIDHQLDLILVDLANKSDDFLQANPIGLIPALITDNGEIYYSSQVICEYIDAVSGPAFLYPEDRSAGLRQRNLIALADGLTDVVVKYMLEGFRPAELQSEAMKSKHLVGVDRTITEIAKRLPEFDMDCTPAAIALGTALGYLEFRFPQHTWKAQYSALAAWYDPFLQRPSMQKTIPVS